MRRLEEEHVQVIDSWPHPSSRTRLARDQRLIHALLDECNHGQVALSDAGVADRLIGCWPDGSSFDLVMATAHDVRVHERPPPTGTTPEDRPLTLSEEHGLLLRQVAIRAGEVLAMTADGGWPTRELQALLTYMRAEVLRQAVDEERLLFPSHSSTSTVGGLARDHTTLHLMTEMLADAATEDRPHHPAQLAATTQELVAHLERHLNAEQAALVADGHNEAPGTTHPDRRPHQWYALTEAATIDLDALPPSRIVDAVADRLLRLRSGEQVELHSSRDPYAVWQRMDRLRPGDYGFDYVQDGPDKWLVQVSRRQPAE